MIMTDKKKNDDVIEQALAVIEIANAIVQENKPEDKTEKAQKSK